jgi:hypothetical protein
MRGKANSRHRQIGAQAKAAFLAGLREGLRREDAAAAATSASPPSAATST